MTFNVNYTWSHAIDDGSTWHSGATSANGAGAGEGYTTDVMLAAASTAATRFSTSGSAWLRTMSGNFPSTSRSKESSVTLLGGWQYNGIVSWQTGAHWEPWTTVTADIRSVRIGVLTGDPDTFVRGLHPGPDRQQACVNVGGDYNLDGVRNDRPNVAANHFSPATITGRTDGVRIPVIPFTNDPTS